MDTKFGLVCSLLLYRLWLQVGKKNKTPAGTDPGFVERGGAPRAPQARSLARGSGFYKRFVKIRVKWCILEALSHHLLETESMVRHQA